MTSLATKDSLAGYRFLVSTIRYADEDYTQKARVGWQEMEGSFMKHFAENAVCAELRALKSDTARGFIGQQVRHHIENSPLIYIAASMRPLMPQQ